mmetsp:Transcript_34486/g.62030  ORF Transcript_34486/g.62030 Transcript_34486/m.62030 type:complete len:107 (+) Transcript_34486:1018-1338(+)
MCVEMVTFIPSLDSIILLVASSSTASIIPSSCLDPNLLASTAITCTDVLQSLQGHNTIQIAASMTPLITADTTAKPHWIFQMIECISHLIASRGKLALKKVATHHG